MRISEILILLTIWYQPATVKTSTTITTVYKSCELDSGSHTYSCTSNGKFSEPLDASCTKYYLCVQYSPSYIVISLSCPEGTYFDPSIQECTSDYPCFSAYAEVINYIAIAECGVTTQNFSCTAEGQFADLNDNTCSKYYVCTGYGDSYIKTELSCSQGSYFDRQNNVCDTNYTCPCQAIGTSSATDVTTLKITSPSSDSSSLVVTTAKNASSTETSLSNEAITATSSLSTTSQGNTEVCIINYDPEYFSCNTKGRFPNLNDLTCQTYFLCNLLRNGSYLQTSYGCPESSYFNPQLQVCDVNYTCPCQGITITSSTGTTSSSADTSGSTEIETEPTTSSADITSSTHSSTLPTDTPTSTTEDTVEPCIINYDPNYFVCSAKGRYSNLNDPTCQTYFLCNLLRNGSYLQTSYSCPELSYFNPQLQVCDVSYSCPCQGAVTTTTTESTSGITDNSSASSSIETATDFSDLSSTTAPTVVTTPTTTESTKPCVINDDPDYFTCSTRGRFPNLNDSTCQTYFLCNQLRNGSYLQTSYNCPESSYFNPTLQACDISYACPCT